MMFLATSRKEYNKLKDGDIVVIPLRVFKNGNESFKTAFKSFYGISIADSVLLGYRRGCTKICKVVSIRESGDLFDAERIFQVRVVSLHK